MCNKERGNENHDFMWNMSTVIESSLRLKYGPSIHLRDFSCKLGGNYEEQEYTLDYCLLLPNMESEWAQQIYRQCEWHSSPKHSHNQTFLLIFFQCWRSTRLIHWWCYRLNMNILLTSFISEWIASNSQLTQLTFLLRTFF